MTHIIWLILWLTYFGVKVDGHKTMLGFGISAISEHSVVWSGNLADIHWTLSSPLATFTWRSLSDVNWRYWIEVIPVAVVERGSSSVPTRESILNESLFMSHRLIYCSPFGDGTSQIFGKWNMEWKVRSFFWTIWEVKNWSIGFSNLPLKERRWEGGCAICFTDTDILSGCWNFRFKVVRNQPKNSPVRSNPHVGWVIWAETSSLGVGSSWIS